MARVRSARRLVVWSAATLVLASPAHAQDWFADVAFNQSVTSLDALPSPSGLVINAGGLGLWGPLGLHLRYERIWGADCLQDAACWPDRDVFGLSAGFGWVFRAGSRD